MVKNRLESPAKHCSGMYHTMNRMIIGQEVWIDISDHADNWNRCIYYTLLLHITGFSRNSKALSGPANSGIMDISNARFNQNDQV